MEQGMGEPGYGGLAERPAAPAIGFGTMERWSRKSGSGLVGSEEENLALQAETCLRRRGVRIPEGAAPGSP